VTRRRQREQHIDGQLHPVQTTKTEIGGTPLLAATIVVIRELNIRIEPISSQTSDTEQEDEEDNRDFANSTVLDSILSKHYSQLNQGSPTPRLTKAHKGKGRDGRDIAADIDSVHEQGTHKGESIEDDTMDVDADPEPLHSHKAVRRFSKEEVEEVDAFGRRVNEEAVQLANKWHRQPHDIMF